MELPDQRLHPDAPANLKDCRGQLIAGESGETDYGSEVYVAHIIYLARTDEERKAMDQMAQESNGELTPELMEAVDAYYADRNPLLANLVCAKKILEDAAGRLKLIRRDKEKNSFIA